MPMALQFAKPWLLSLLVFIPVYWMIWLHRQKPSIPKLPFSGMADLVQVTRDSVFWKYFYPVLRSLILLFLIIAIAQPRWGRGIRDYRLRGVDIVLAMDISGSMSFMDFGTGSRLDAAVKVAQDFVERRANDRFGLVAFSEYALTQIPLTYDRLALSEMLASLQVNQDASGTAIGLGLAKAVARLRSGKAKSKVVILITDGVNNTGEIDPLTAADMAKAFGIRVYPIGVGGDPGARMPFDDPIFGNLPFNAQLELDMETLDRIASLTGTGKAARATDTAQLEEIMDRIDQLEKTDYQVKLRYHWSEKFMFFLWGALLLMLTELLCRLYFKPVLPEY